MEIERRYRPERMDDPTLPEKEHVAALAGLARINRLSFGARHFWTPLRDLARRHGALKVLDVATGGGDVPVALARGARRHGVPLTFAGCDKSPRAVARARAEAAGVDVEFFQADALRDPLDGYDVYMCSLFLHHLAEDDAVALLRRLAGGRALLVQDLRRCRGGLALAWAGTRVLTRSPVVHADGPQSVRNAFTLAEVAELARRAGLDGARVGRRWPYRYLLEWERP